MTLKTMLYITTDIQPFLKDIVMQIELLGQLKQNPQVDTFLLLVEVAISWKSSKQTRIARSIMESEFIALDKADEEAEWLRNFLEDIPFWPKPMTPICIHCDSQAAIGRDGSIMYNGKSRHIRRRHNSVR